MLGNVQIFVSVFFFLKAGAYTADDYKKNTQQQKREGINLQHRVLIIISGI